MSVTSANPDALDTFVHAGPSRRATAGGTAGSGARLAVDVAARCRGRGLSATNFAAVTALLDTMAATDQFVDGVADAVRGADRYGGVATVSDTAIMEHLAEGGYDTALTTISISSVALLGEPPNSGLIDDPICAANGNFIHRDLDLVFHGTSAALNLHRFYNSLAAERVGAFGAGWRTVLDVAIGAAGPGLVDVSLADGAVVRFERRGDTWVTADRRRLALSDLTDGYELHDRNDAGNRRWYFDTAGVLRSWQVGCTRVEIERNSDTRPTRLTLARAGREVRLEWAGDRCVAAASSDGRRVTYHYGEADTMCRVESASGWFDYSYAGRLLVAAHDPDGVSEFVNDYDEHGRVHSQRSSFGRVTTYRYDTDGTTVVSDQHGSRQAMVHDRRGNLTAVIDPDGSVMRIEYDPRGRATRVVSRSGAVWQHEFDGDSDRLAARIDPDGHSQHWQYDELGRSSATTDRAGHTTRFEYRADHATPSRVVGPDGAVALTELDAWGQPTAITDPDGYTTRLVWNGDGQLAALTDAGGETTTFEFDLCGRLTAIANVAHPERAAAFDYDSAGRLIASTTQLGQATYDYTLGGRCCGGSQPDTAAWSARFGDHGALEVLIDPTGAQVSLRHDHLGNVTEVIAPDGASYRHEHDATGRLVATIAPDASASHQLHDLDGNVVEIVDPAGRGHRRSVDAFVRTTSITDPSGATRRWSYHPSGAVATVELADGRTLSTDVDAAGRIVALHDDRGATTHCTYSPAGRMLTRLDPDGSLTTFEYDAAGRLRQPGAATDRVDPLAQLGATFVHDGRGLLTSAIDPAGLVTEFGYDVRGRLTSHTTPGDRATTWSYDLAGRVAQMIDPAGVTTDITRDPAGAIVGVRRGDVGWTRSLDHNGREVARRALDGAALVEYRYDPCGRIVEGWNPASGLLTRLEWDVASADTPAGAPSVHAQAGPLLADRAGIVYRYDHAGRLVERLDPEGRCTRYEYGGDGLLAVERSPGGVRRFRYDAAGRVAAISVDGRGTTTIDYDEAGRRCGEQSPEATTRYRWNATDQLVAIERDSPSGERLTTTIDYDAFGRPRAINGAPIDDAAGPGCRIGHLSVLGARVVDHTTHQFLSSDPLMTLAGSNGAASAYTYAWHDPVGFVDPSGLRPISIEEYQAMREREERGSFGMAWQAIKEDPWGTLAAVGVVAAGVGLMFVPGGQAIGIGILAGAGVSTIVGLATGTFDPRQVAINGVIGGFSAGAAGAGWSMGRTVVAGGVLNAGADVSQQLASGQPIDWQSVVVSGGTGMLTAGLAHYLQPSMTTSLRTAAYSGAIDTYGSAAHTTLTGGNPLSWNTVIDGVTSAGSNGLTHYATPPSTTFDITPASHGSPRPSTSPVLVDTNMVYNRPGVNALLQPGEYPVISTTVRAEVANNAAAGKMHTPSYIDDFPVVADAGGVNTRITVREAVVAGTSNQRGVFGDGVIGATTIETGMPLITNDRRLAQAVAEMGGEVRRP